MDREFRTIIQNNAETCEMLLSGKAKRFPTVNQKSGNFFCVIVIDLCRGKLGEEWSVIETEIIFLVT